MLTSFTLENFKSFREPATLPLAPLTMLAGANASGKSNLVEALRLFSCVVENDLLFVLSEALLDRDEFIRGNMNDWTSKAGESISFSCRTTHREWNKYSITLGRDSGLYFVSDECLCQSDSSIVLFETSGEKFFGSSQNARFNKVVYPGSESDKVIYVNSNSLALLAQNRIHIEKNDMIENEELVASEVANLYVQWISNMMFLYVNPIKMRTYSSQEEKILNRDGSNLSGVLHNLCQDSGIRRKLLDLIRSIPEQDIQDIDFIRTPRNEAMVKLTESFGGSERKFDASLLSDGTLRVLATAAAVLSAKEGSLVVIEEIDNGIHPSRAGALLQQLDEIAKERNLRLLLTAHNPALLDALPEDAVPAVVFCFRHPETGASELTRLSDLTDYSGLVARGGIGSLMTQGIVDRFVKNPRTPEEKKKQALAWLEALKAETA